MTIPYLMNCKHDGDGWCLDCVKTLGEENERLRAELVKHQTQHTLIQCASCDNGVRNRYAVKGMCPDCAETLIDDIIAAWPCNSIGTVYSLGGTWYHDYLGITTEHPTREAAIQGHVKAWKEKHG